MIAGTPASGAGPKPIRDMATSAAVVDVACDDGKLRFDEMRRRYRDAHPELTSRKRWADVFEQQ